MFHGMQKYITVKKHQNASLSMKTWTVKQADRQGLPWVEDKRRVIEPGPKDRKRPQVASLCKGY